MALERRYGAVGQYIGSAAPSTNDDWRVSLPQARDTLEGLSRAVGTSVEAGNLPVMVASTCAASLASLPVVARECPDGMVLWIDAHGDFNTPATTGTGYLGGMVLSAACGLWDSGHGAGLRPENILLVGVRDTDQAESELLQDAGVRILPPGEATPESILAAVGSARVWVHLDWDVLEPGFVPTDYSVPGGMTPAQLRAIFQAIPLAQLIGIELAEFQVGTDSAADDRAIHTILDTIAPLLEGHSLP
jgi:arginase/N-omega-hydroxy-L-arginine amidinohydrolase